MNPKRRSEFFAIIGGMMAAAYLHSEAMVDLSYGFPSGSLAEGALLTVTGVTAGIAVLIVFRLARALLSRIRN